MSTLPKRKRKKKTKNQYFTQATEDAIVRYNESSDPEERSEIYRKDIHYAFFKLTENIIHTFKFYYTEVDNLEDLKHEVIVFLLEKLCDYRMDFLFVCLCSINGQSNRHASFLL